MSQLNNSLKIVLKRLEMLNKYLQSKTTLPILIHHLLNTLEKASLNHYFHLFDLMYIFLNGWA